MFLPNLNLKTENYLVSKFFDLPISPPLLRFDFKACANLGRLLQYFNNRTVFIN